jgi:hypothetical protein
MHRLARGHIDSCDAHLVSGVPEDLSRRIGLLRAHIGQQNMFTYTNPPSDSLTDLTSSDDDYYASHRSSFRERFAF